MLTQRARVPDVKSKLGYAPAYGERGVRFSVLVPADGGAEPATLRQKHLPQFAHFRTPNELFRGSSSKDNYNKHSSNYTKEISPLLKTYQENHHSIGVSKNPELS